MATCFVSRTGLFGKSIGVGGWENGSEPGTLLSKEEFQCAKASGSGTSFTQSCSISVTHQATGNLKTIQRGALLPQRLCLSWSIKHMLANFESMFAVSPPTGCPRWLPHFSRPFFRNQVNVPAIQQHAEWKEALSQSSETPWQDFLRLGSQFIASDWCQQTWGKVLELLFSKDSPAAW